MNRETGRPLDGWDHVVQSLNVIFSTPYHQRVMLRYFGSDIPSLLGQPMTERTIMSVIYSALVGVELWEPRFRVVSAKIATADNNGQLGFNLEGIYYPNGQNGDFTSSMRRSLVMLARNTGMVALPAN